MPGTLALASLLMTLAPVAATTDQGSEAAKVDVAATELSQGRPQDAIDRIEANSELDDKDPARLINLGTAYMQQGRFDDAEAAFKAAIMSDERYELELTDGRWIDSRKAARIALNRLYEGKQLAGR